MKVSSTTNALRDKLVVGDADRASVTLGFMPTLNVSRCRTRLPRKGKKKKKAPDFRHPHEVLNPMQQASKLSTDGHDWFFPLSNSVSVQRVFIEIERIINKTTKKEKKNIQKALISSNEFPNNKYVE